MNFNSDPALEESFNSAKQTKSIDDFDKEEDHYIAEIHVLEEKFVFVASGFGTVIAYNFADFALIHKFEGLDRMKISSMLVTNNGQIQLLVGLSSIEEYCLQILNFNGKEIFKGPTITDAHESIIYRIR